MTAWLHSRRGLIEGEVVRHEPVWVQIRLTADSPRTSTRARGHGPIDLAGTVITVRRAFLTVVPEPADPQEGAE